MTKVTSDALAVLSGLTYFRPLPAADLRRLAAQSTVRAVRRGQRVFEEGTRATILDACRRHPDVALGIIGVLARRVRSFAGLVEQLSLKDLTARTAALLLEESRASGAPTFVLGATRDELAARLGTVRELVSRALGRLRTAGLIRVAGRKVTIVDLRGLKDLAEDTGAGG